jgi:hypothetical protein
MVTDIINSQSTVDDIIAIIEPKNPAERVTHHRLRWTMPR